MRLTASLSLLPNWSLSGRTLKNPFTILCATVEHTHGWLLTIFEDYYYPPGLIHFVVIGLEID